MKKLTPMTDFIEEQEKIIPATEHGPVKDWDRIYVKRTISYCRFLRQPLTLGMFVPVDEYGNFLEPLKFCCNGSDCGCMGQPVNVGSQKEIDDYYEAKEKVLFEGFFTQNGNQEVDKHTTYLIHEASKCVVGYKKEWEDDWNFEGDVIEDIVSYNLTLTPSVLKQIGIESK